MASAPSERAAKTGVSSVLAQVLSRDYCPGHVLCHAVEDHLSVSLHQMNEQTDFCNTISTDLLAYEFLRRSKSTLQYKSKQPHAPICSHTFGSSSIYLFPKSAVLLLQVLVKREQRYVLYQLKNNEIRSLSPSWEKQVEIDILSRKAEEGTRTPY